MSETKSHAGQSGGGTGSTSWVFDDAAGYDRSIDWSARIAREVPVLIDALGPPGAGGILDAGCGPGRQAIALSRRGYRVIGADASADMVAVARRNAAEAGVEVEFFHAPYAALHEAVGDGLDGLYCLGNALAASGTRERVAEALDRFARCLRAGGRLLIQIVNFPRMRGERPCVRGPRVTRIDGREFISVRVFHFEPDRAEVTNVTTWNDGGWHQRARVGWLYPLTREELTGLCADSGLRIDDVWGSYTREPFDPDHSSDLIVVATRV